MNRRKVLVRVALVAAPFVVAELVLRAAHGPGGPAAEARRIAAELTVAGDGLETTPLAQREPLQGAAADPFVGWGTQRMWERIAAGFGGDDTYDVLVVGGSVAVFVQKGGLPDMLEAMQQDPRLAERDIRFHNLAAGGRKQPQQLHLVSAVLHSGGTPPDAVINIDGFNELALSVQNGRQYGVYPLQPSYTLWAPLMTGHVDDPELLERAFDVQRERRRAVALVRTAERWHLDASALLSAAVLGRMRSIRARQLAATERYFAAAELAAPTAALAGPPYDGSLEAAVDLAVSCWAESSRSLHAICAQRGIAYLHVLQPTLLDEGSKPRAADERAHAEGAPTPWSDAVRLGYDRLRTEGRRLREEGVAFHDASRLFADIEESLYSDPCHFFGRGNYVFGKRIGRAFAAEAFAR